MYFVARGTFIIAAITGLATGCCKSQDDPSEAPAASASPAESPPLEPVTSAEPPAPPADSASASTTPPKPSARPPTNNTSGANAVKACCNALNTEASKAKGPDKAPYNSALAVCNGLVKKVESGAVTQDGAKLTIRAQLQRAKSIPSACK